MRRPPITVTCECGESRDLAYGERWRCERCGRTYDTNRIPAEEYDSLLRTVRRHRMEAVALGLALVATFVVLIVVVSNTFVYLIPIVAGVWLFLYLPMWRRRVRSAARNAPRWQLRAE